MTMADFNYEEITTKTLEAIPEIKGAYEEEVLRWTSEPLGPYNLFDIVLMPHIIGLLRAKGHEEELKRAFDFFETLMEHPNRDVRDVVGVAVCEDLCSDERALQKACRFMGPKTKQSCDAYLK